MALKRRLRDDLLPRKSLRATNVELQGRDIFVKNTDDKIYSRDYDNLYPERIEKVINNSPTGRRCANLMAKYITGQGVSNEVIVNKRGETLNDIIDKASNDIAYQYGVYFHTSWKLNTETGNTFLPGSLRVLDYVSMAKSQEDGDEFPGKYYYLKKKQSSVLWEMVNEETTWYYPYNNNPDIIRAQMLNDCKLKGITSPTMEQMLLNYRGQVYYMNLTPKFIYALPLGDSVYNDMDTEFQISQYQNQQTRNGWLGKTVMVMFDDEEDEDGEADQVITDNLGSENSANPLIIKVPMVATDDLKKAFVVDQLKAQFDDKLFESTIKSIRQNILGAFNNIPEPLIFSMAGHSLFGPSGDTYGQMKQFYWEQNEYERFKLESTLSKLLGFKVSFIPMVSEAVTTTNNGGNGV